MDYTSLTGETSPLSDFGVSGADYHASISKRTVALSDPSLIEVTRLRLLGGYPWWDVSYCHGTLADGTRVRVDLGADQIDRNYKPHLVRLCKESGRYGVGLGIFEAVSLLPG